MYLVIKERLKKIKQHKGKLKYVKNEMILLEWNSVPSSNNLEFSLETFNPIILTRRF